MSETKPLTEDQVNALVENSRRTGYRPYLYAVQPGGPSALLEKSMAFIETNPHLHDQEVWRRTLVAVMPGNDSVCGTAACLAGWGVALNNEIEGHQISTGTGHVVLADQTSVVEITGYAASLFNISPSQANILFQPDWTIKALRAGVDALHANPDIASDDLSDSMWSTYHSL